MAWHHVMNRGRLPGEVFPTTGDREEFLRLTAEISTRFLVEIHAYCLMSHHYHLLLRAARPNLGPAMRELDRLYTEGFHGRHGGLGELFRGRHHAVAVRADAHRVRVSRYVHLNPVEAGLVARPEDWPFSSYAAYLDPAREPSWLTTATILGWFGSIGARRHYRRFVEEGLDPRTRDPYGRARLRPVLADDEFRDELRRRAALELTGPRGRFADLEWPGRNGAVPLAAIARAVCEVFDVPREALRPRSRGRGLARGTLVHAARSLGGYRLPEIAAWLGYASSAAVARAALRFGEQAQQDPKLRSRLQAVVDRAVRT
jgi:REP element-mobilizing transposase RayT